MDKELRLRTLYDKLSKLSKESTKEWQEHGRSMRYEALGTVSDIVKREYDKLWGELKSAKVGAILVEIGEEKLLKQRR